MFCEPVCLMKVELKALIEIGTFWTFCDRNCAVTTTSSMAVFGPVGTMAAVCAHNEVVDSSSTANPAGAK
jgi:hypothetical protein